jgi:hypothetical protein
MARFVVHNQDKFWVVLDAEDGEEVTTEQAAAWGHIRTAAALDWISDQLRDISLEIGSLKS